jgi:type IV secretory pathway VirB2 component (pilin)
MNRNIITLIIVIFIAINALAASASFAAAVPCSSNSNAVCNPLNSSDITALLTGLVNIAIPIGAVIAVIMYIVVGFKFIFAQGKSEKITDAWKWFAYVSIGTAILIGAKVIVTIMESTLTSAGLVKQGLLPTQ